ncbi:MAG: hypothetical protein KJS97_09795 [Alphaproteobacteria bacterium]|nr:hypothetical protein [Alphaproteobacteria bacterium]
MDPRALKFWSQLADFGPDSGPIPVAQAQAANDDGAPRNAGPREWVVDFDEPRLSPGQTGFLAHMIGQVIGAARPTPPQRPYAQRTLRPGIAFDRTA